MDDPQATHSAATPPTPILAYQTPQAALAAAPISGLARLACVVFGVLLPAGCLLAAMEGVPIAPEFQSGQWHDKVAIFLVGAVGWPFYPLLVCSMICLALLALSPMRRVTSFPIRLGVYTGVPLALQYGVIMAIALFRPPSLVSVEMLMALAAVAGASAVPIAVLWGLRHLSRRFGAGRVATGIVLLTVAAVVISTIVDKGLFPGLLLAPLVFALAGSPALSLAAYATMSHFAWRYAGGDAPTRREVTFRGAGWLAWAGAYGVAWRLAAANAIVEYAKLPTTPPGCYVATAAACGHRRVVRSRPVRAASGEVFLANDQMRCLKAAEIVLRSISPAAHRACRRVYDRYGPLLASRLTRPHLADVAYFALKPVEWAAAFVLHVALDADRAKTLWLYRTDDEPSRVSRSVGPGRRSDAIE